MAAVEHLVVTGRGVGLSMAACILASRLKPFGIKISCVELCGEEASLPVITTGPEVLPLWQMLGLEFKAVFTHCHGTFRLGDVYQNNGYQHVVALGHYGLSADAVEMEQGLWRFMASQPDVPLSAFSIAAQAGLQGKFAIPGPKQQQWQQALTFGLHLDTNAYKQVLKQQSEKLGCRYFTCASAEFDPQHRILRLENGENLTADFVIRCDCDDAEGQAFWQVSASKPVGDMLSPLGLIAQTPWGWNRQVSTQKASYCMSYAPQETVREEEIRQWDMHTEFSQVEVKAYLKPTVPESLWQGQQLQLGAAGQSLGNHLYDPLLIQQYLLVRWLDLYPNRPDCASIACMYNRHWNEFVGELQQFHLLHRGDWQQSDIACIFQRCGRLPPLETDVLSPTQWYGLCDAMGLKPELHSAMLSRHSDSEIFTPLQQVRKQIQAVIQGMPSQAEFIRQWSSAH